MSFRAWQREHNHEWRVLREEIERLVEAAYEAGVKEGLSQRSYQALNMEPLFEVESSKVIHTREFAGKKGGKQTRK